jgi:hypothetical protein
MIHRQGNCLLTRKVSAFVVVKKWTRADLPRFGQRDCLSPDPASYRWAMSREAMVAVVIYALLLTPVPREEKNGVALDGFAQELTCGYRQI